MATLSNEFFNLVSQLQQTPNNPVLKKAVVQNLPKMIALAKENPMELYHLASIYPPNSPQYKQTMRQAANLGCTNAMLDMCQKLVKSSDPNDLKKATHYIEMIDKSNDSYIKEQLKSLIKEYPQLINTLQERTKPSYIPLHRFFTTQQDGEAELKNIVSTPTAK